MDKTTKAILVMVWVAVIALSINGIREERLADYWRKQYDAEKASHASATLASWSLPAGYLNQVGKHERFCTYLQTESTGAEGRLNAITVIDSDDGPPSPPNAAQYGPIDLSKVIAQEIKVQAWR